MAMLLLGTALLASGSTPRSTVERMLDNGMKIVVREDRRAPVVTSMVWYRVGSIDEVNGLTGLAHVTEHMMFRGTRRLADGEFSRRVAQIGGRDNAFTGRDYTAYHQQLSAKDLGTVIELEAERMSGVAMQPEVFAREMQVVMEERRWRTDDRPRAALFEQLYATAFSAHPYRTPVIGWMNDLENLTVDDAREFYRRWYAPNNAVLVVVGDVDAEQVFRLANRHFGRLAARPLPRRSPQVEPEQRGTRRVTFQGAAQSPFLMLGFHVPVLRDADRDWEPYALEVQRGPGLFVISAAPGEGRSVVELEAAIRAEIGRVAREGIAADELSRAQTQLVAQYLFQQDSMFTQASRIGQAEMVGHSARVFDRFVTRTRAVTADQVREVARRYLIDDRMTVAVLEPTVGVQRKPALPPKDARHVD
ncbi:MAG: pitrilysin family protein [Proteobacteria bacterium]|nr:pitrilysin family protein [Pseudomonadota bacterium]